jgi:NADPH-dependent 2,4-dienoyl-CoA reductase/sulfur reductase-like enzyme
MQSSAFVDFDVRDRILIVGSGASGLAAAYELRRLGFAGELVIMGDEPEGHYDRPACSKGILTGHKRPSDVITPLDPDLDVIWRLGRRAVSCDLNRRVVEAHTGEMIYFDGLVIASGCRPVVPMDWPDDQPGLHILHGLPAAWELRRELRNAKRVAVVGGGVTGCEVACAVKDLARQAVIIEPRPFVMGRAVGSLVGHMIAASHRRSGIELATGGRVSTVDVRGGRWYLTLKDGSTVDADLVVAAMGERPDLDWLEGTGIDISDGVLCDESLRVMTTDGHAVEGVVACGSLARWPNPRGNGKPARCGQWIAAQEQGQGAARTLLAGGRPVPAVPILPRYWTYQLGLRIEVCGELDPKADIEVHELRPGKKDVAKAGVLATYHRDGKLIGSVAVNAPRRFTDTARMMRLDEPSVTVIPALPAPVSPAVPTLERPPVRLALTAGPEPMPGPDPMYNEPANLPEPAYKYQGYDPGYGYGRPEPEYPPPGYSPRSGAGYMPTYPPHSGAGYGRGYEPGYAPRSGAGYDPGYAPHSGAGYGRGYEPGYAPRSGAGYDAGYAPTGYDRTYQPTPYDRGYQTHGYEPAPHEPSAYDRGYEPAPYDRGGYDRGGYEQAGYERAGYEQPAYEQAGYERAGYDKAYERSYERGYEQPGYDRGYDRGYGPGGYEPAGYVPGYGPAYDSGYNPAPYGRHYGQAFDGYGQPAYEPTYGSGGYGSRHDRAGGYGPQREPVYGAAYGTSANLPVPREPTRREQGYGPNPNYSGPHAGSGYGPTSGPGYGSGTYGPPQQDWYWRPSLATVA